MLNAKPCRVGFVGTFEGGTSCGPEDALPRYYLEKPLFTIAGRVSRVLVAAVAARSNFLAFSATSLNARLLPRLAPRLVPSYSPGCRIRLHALVVCCVVYLACCELKREGRRESGTASRIWTSTWERTPWSTARHTKYPTPFATA